MASSGNYPTFNSLVYTGQSLTHVSGNLEVESGSFWSSSIWSRMTMAGYGGSTGKYYAEFVNYGSSGGGSTVCGIGNYDSLAINTTKHNDAIIYYYDYILQNGTQINIGGNYSSPPGISGNEVLRMAWDCSNGKVWLGGSQEWFDVGSGVGDPANGNNPSGTISNFTNAPIGVLHNRSTNTGRCIMNFGQNGDFSGTLTAQNNTDENGDGNFYYSVPTGFVCLNSKNLTIASGIDPAQTDDFSSKQFNAVTYTGTGSATTISGLGLQPDLIWAKTTSTSSRHYLVDSSRGFTKFLHSEDTYSEGGPNSTGVTSANSDGFVIGGGLDYVNYSGRTFVAWCWRANGGTTVSNSEGSISATIQANTEAGFCIATYTGGSGSWGSSYRSTFGHGLTKAPEFMIFKERDNTDAWTVFHHSVGDGGGSNPASNNLRLDTNEALYTNQSYKSFGGVMPTSSLVTVEGNTTNSSSNTHVAYIWHSVEGFSKFGGYTANGSDNDNAVFIYTGFRPKLLVIKGISATNNWMVFDSARSTFNSIDNHMKWDTTSGETTEDYRDLDFLSNGFKIRSNNGALNHPSGDKYVYMCWGDASFKYQSNTF